MRGVIPPDFIRESNNLRVFEGSSIRGCDCARAILCFGSSTGVGVGPGVWALLRFFVLAETFCFRGGVNFLKSKNLDYIWETYGEVAYRDWGHGNSHFYCRHGSRQNAKGCKIVVYE